MKNLESAKEGILLLETQFQSADGQVRGLEKSRRSLLQEVEQDKEALKRDERENAVLKQTVEALQRKLLSVNANLVGML